MAGFHGRPKGAIPIGAGTGSAGMPKGVIPLGKGRGGGGRIIVDFLFVSLHFQYHIG